MKRTRFARILASAAIFCCVDPTNELNAEDTPSTRQQGNVVFNDDFERDESSSLKEEVGGGWTTNSGWRAAGKKQVDLDGGAMHVTRVPEADHGVAIFHDVAYEGKPLRNLSVQMKFKLGRGDDLGIDFVDRELHSVHAGHLCMARVRLGDVTLMDSKTGHMDLKIRERRQNGEKSAELTELIQSKQATFPLKLAADEWHTILVVIEGDEMSIVIDGKSIGKFKSEGFAHETKRMITLAVNKSAWVDDVRVMARNQKSGTAQ